MQELRFAIIGTGFWSRYQLAGWGEVTGVRCVAVCDQRRERAEAVAGQFGIGGIYTDAEQMIAEQSLDFVDVITDVATHPRFVELAAARRLAVICQKPMAPTLELASSMVAHCREAGNFFGIHENWRWQTPIREVKRVLESGAIGTPFRARLDFNCSFPVFENQPFLKELDQFIITDVGSHVLDVARMLFGEAESVYCQTKRIHQDIHGEDVATVVMRMGPAAATITCNLSYASRTEHERFPETFMIIEGEHGSVELSQDHWIRVTTAAGTHARRCPPPHYDWADPRYGVVHSSIVDCNRDLVEALRSGRPAETDAADNLRTVELVFAAYASARENCAVPIPFHSSSPS